MRPVRYREAQTETRLEYANYNDAARRLDLAHIRERAAELGSQSFESVGKGKLFERIGTLSDTQREVALAFVRYAVYGRTDEE